MRGCWGQNEARGKTPVESEHPFPKGIKWATLNKSAQINVVEKEGSDTSRSLPGSLFFVGDSCTEAAGAQPTWVLVASGNCGSTRIPKRDFTWNL